MVKAIMIRCPTCGERLNYTGGERVVTCEWCHGTFPIQNELNDRMKRGFQLIAQSNYSMAHDVLEEAAVIDPQNGRIFFGMLLCDLTVNSPAKLAKVNVDITKIPNYQNAITYLDAESRGELEQLAAMNKANLSAPKVAASYPTPLMNEFTKANAYTLNGKTVSYIALIDAIKDEPLEKKVQVFGMLKAGIEKTFDLYKQLTDDEKKHLAFFDNSMALRALAAYEQFLKDSEDYKPARGDIDEDEEDECEEEQMPAPESAPHASTVGNTTLVIETYNYSRLEGSNVIVNVSRTNAECTVRITAWLDQNGNYCNREGYPIQISGRNGVLYVKAQSDSGSSNTMIGLGGGNQTIGTMNFAGANIGGGNVVVGNVSNNSGRIGEGINFGNDGSAGRRVIINGVEYKNDFQL